MRFALPAALLGLGGRALRRPSAWLGLVPPRVALAMSSVAAAVGLTAIFAYALSNVPRDLWLHRDDGVITLSHARNLIDFGFIGVNPSGERVEGYSAPLQFVLFVFAYALTGTGYARFADVQTVLGGVGLGAALFAILFLLCRRAWLALGGTLVAAILLQRSSTFLLWHASGMENALTHATYAGTWAVLMHQLERANPRLGWALVPVLAAWSRFESVLHVAPMLVAFAAFHYRAHRTLAGLRFAGVALLAWGALFGVRAAYFGHSAPNTAYAQDIPVALYFEQLVLGRVPAGTVDLAWSVCRSNLGVLAFFLLPLSLLAPASRQTRFVLVLGVLALGSAVLNVFLFGPARLDPPRTVTFLAPLTTVAAVGLALVSPRLSWSVAAVGLLLSPLVRPLTRVGPYELCCAASLFEHNRAEFQRLRDRHELPRPLVASPDLGAVSFTKEFNVLDLGYLGSTVLPQLSDSQSTNDYVFRIAQPDIIELHAAWAANHHLLLADPRLRRLYRPWTPSPSPFVSGYCTGHCFWVRKAVERGSGSRERALIDAFTTARDPRVIEQAVTDCNARAERDGCLHVVRVAYRFLPDLSASAEEQVSAALERIQEDAQRDLARAVLAGRSGADQAAAVRRYLERVP